MSRTLALVAAPGHAGEAVRNYLNALFPYLGDLKKTEDKKLVEAMEQEVRRGPLAVRMVETKLVQSAVKKYTMSNEDRRRLAEASRKRVHA